MHCLDQGALLSHPASGSSGMMTGPFSTRTPARKPPCAAINQYQAWKKPAITCLPSSGCPQVNGSRRGPRTLSNGCTRSSSVASRRKPCCPRPRPRQCCSGLFSHQARSPCARSTDGRAWANSSPLPFPLTRPPNQPNYHPAEDTTLKLFPHKSLRHPFDEPWTTCFNLSAADTLRRSRRKRFGREAKGLVSSHR